MQQINTIAILAGGLATRMRPLTEKIPKAMLTVAGEPFIGHQLKLFARQGISHAVILAGHLGENIQDYVGDGHRFGLQVSYSFDGDFLLGTGGAVKKAAHLLGDAYFIIYGDSFLNIDYQQVAQHFFLSEKKALMTIYRNEGAFDASNVVFENGIIQSYSKKSFSPNMIYIDYGLGVLSPAAFANHSKRNSFDLADVYEFLVSCGGLAGYEVEKRFYEIGSQKGLLETETYLLNHYRPAPVHLSSGLEPYK